MDFHSKHVALTDSASPKQMCVVLEENLKVLRAQYRHRTTSHEERATEPLRGYSYCLNVKFARELGCLSSFFASRYKFATRCSFSQSLYSAYFRDAGSCVCVGIAIFVKARDLVCHQIRLNCCWLVVYCRPYCLSERNEDEIQENECTTDN